MTKVLGILGANYCGSTILDMVLNSHPDVVGVGEINFIVDKWFKPQNGVARVGCEACHFKKTKCPLMPIEDFPFRAKDVHRILGQRAGTEWVVDSSKDTRVFEHYEAKQSAEEYKYVVLVKKPEAAAASYEKHYRPANPPWAPGAPASPSGDAISHTWCAHYERILDFIQTRSYRVFRFEDFAQNPMSVLEEIASFMGLPMLFDPIHYGDAPDHRIAGNYAVKRDKRPVGYSEGWKKHPATMSPSAWKRMHKLYRQVEELAWPA